MIRPTLKLFGACDQGELIRFTEEGQTHWALVGDHGREQLMLLVLPLNSPPYCENILGEIDTLRPPYNVTTILSYGKGYSIHVDHAGDCNVGGGGALTRTPGAHLVDHLLQTRADLPRNLAYNNMVDWLH
jgi:hypothetical protein